MHVQCAPRDLDGLPSCELLKVDGCASCNEQVHLDLRLLVDQVGVSTLSDRPFQALGIDIEIGLRAQLRAH